MATVNSSIAAATNKAIINRLTAQQGTGTLASVRSIGTTTFPEANVYPYVGVELVHRKEEIWGSLHKKSILTFAISISVRTTADTSTLADAVSQRDLIIDDGSGNGIEPILRSFNLDVGGALNGTSIKAEILDVLLTTNAAEDKSASPSVYYAEGLIMFQVTQQINIA
jgi:hypothetical protein